MNLFVSPLSQVPSLCALRRPSHLLTLLSPGSTQPVLPRRRMPPRRMSLAFHDIAEPREGMVAPDAELVAQILAFAADWTGERPMVVHCWAGISRSTAAAYALACQREPQIPEAQIAAALRRAAPSATPNPLIVALADTLLGREGRMSAAIDAIGRGEDAMEGSAFELALTRAPD